MESFIDLLTTGVLRVEFFITILSVPTITAVCASRHLKQKKTEDTFTALFIYAWSKVVLDTALVWGIALSTAGLIGMAVGMRNINGLAESITIALLAMIWAGIAAGLAHVLERKDIKLKLTLNSLDLVVILICAGAVLYLWIQQTGAPFWGKYFHPAFTSCQFSLVAILVLSALRSSKVWQEVLFEANLGATLILMAIGIASWFLNWSDFQNSRDSIWLIANILFWGGILHVLFYSVVLLAGKGTDAKLRMKTWHLTEAFAFYTFLVYAPIGATEYFRELADQQLLQEQHENQQSEIDELKARLQELEGTKTD